MIDSETVLADVLKVSVSQEALADRLAVVARAVSTRTTVLVLGGIQITAGDGKLQLAATDMEISLRLAVEASVDDPGSVVVPGRLLVDIARLLPPGEVTIEHRAEEGVARLTCGPVSYALHTFNAEDFPRLPEIDAEAAFAVERSAFLDTVA